MAKTKRAEEEIQTQSAETAEGHSAEWMQQTAEDARKDAENATLPESNGQHQHHRRKRSGRVRQIQYWVCGRRHAADPARRIMPAPTIGRARKALAVVREMPDYGGMELWVERCTRVE